MFVKILFISRATLYKDKGGDTVQLVNTARFLKTLGVDVTIRLCNEKIDYSDYDLLHFFNIIRPADILTHVEKSGKPYVVSTIYVDYTEYEKKGRKGMAGLLFKTLSSDFIEYAKIMARFFTNGEKIISPGYVWLGQKKSVRKIIRAASMLLPNSTSEYNRLVSHYKVENRYTVIPNAIDPGLFIMSSDRTKRMENLVICVGRIEGRKNQVNLIRALNNTKYHLVIIGSPSANQVKYYERCRRLAAGNIQFIHSLRQEELVHYYGRAKVHVLPSWFETTGLSSLEAAVMGCNIVITDKGDTREYFENDAYYCDPASAMSILEAVEKAANAGFSVHLRERILTQYTWPRAAKKTYEAYREILEDRRYQLIWI